MPKLYKIQLVLILLILSSGFFFAQKVNAASLINVSDTVTTSRPSPSATSAANINVGDSQVIVGDNGSFYLASDSAVIYPDTGETIDSGRNVASMSAANIPWTGARTVYLTNTFSNVHHKGNAFIVNVTATHIIKFTTSTAIPSGGKIVIGFPGSGVNIASPSATTFSFNNLGTSAVICNPTAACSGTKTITAPNITLTTGGAVSAGTTIFLGVGCTGTINTSGICSTYAPALINPTKSAAAGTADIWRVTITTQDSGSTTLDSAKAIVGTVDAVQVQASIEPTLTFTIAGLANSANYNTSASQCGSETSNSGIDSTATSVNLGILSSGTINKAGQTLTVSTNASTGYTITATSSGHLINAGGGFWLPDANGGNGLTAVDTPAPAAITAGTAAFGISPCGSRVPTSSPTWGGTGQTVTSGALFSNPYNTGVNGYYSTVASYTGGAVTSEITVIRYAAAVAATTPAGTYTTYYTYVATPAF